MESQPASAPSSTGSGAMMFGTFYPKHYVVAVVGDPAEAARAADDLHAAGFAPEEVEVWSGERMLANHDTYLRQHRLLGRLGRLLPGDEALTEAHYLDEARAGCTFVLVLAPQPERRERARRILRAHHGHDLHYYGDRVFMDL